MILIMVTTAILIFYVLIFKVLHMGNGWNNKNIESLVDRILLSLEVGAYTVGDDKRWAYCGVSNTGGSILSCYKNGQLKADGLLLSFSSMFIRSTWYITDTDGIEYYTGFVQGNRLHKKIKAIYKKEKVKYRR